SRRAGRNDSERSQAGNETEIGKLSALALRLVGGCRRAHEAEASLVNRGGSENPGVTEHRLLRPGRGDGCEARHVSAKWIGYGRIIEMIIDRPVACELINNIHALAGLVVHNLARIAGRAEQV